MTELLVDNFAGGGGASTGIAMAVGRSVDIAINHDPEAVAMHRANHPSTRHICQSVFKADPAELTGNRPVGLAWFSPDCKHHSKAKGGKPVEKNIRDLAWVVDGWAWRKKPRVILLENVEEFEDWGPLIDTPEGKKPDPARKGETFKKWVAALRKRGYRVEWRQLRACDYGAPTIRKRLFVIARCDGRPIVWPEPTHGDPKSEAVQSGKLLPWRTAADCIDWSMPCPSIFTRQRPLAENTLKRIAKGIFRYVIGSSEPFIVPLTHHGSDRLEPVTEPMRTVTGAHRGERAMIMPYVARVAHGERDKNGKKRGKGQHDANAPLPTVTASQEFAIVAPYLVGYHSPRREGDHRTHQVGDCLPTQTTENRYGVIAPILVGAGGPAYSGKPKPVDQPLNTLLAENHAQLVSAFLAQHNGGFYEGDGRAADAPLSTITARGTQQTIIAAHILNMKGSDQRMAPADAPMPTQCAGGWHIAEVRAFLLKYYGTEQDPKLTEPLHTVTSRDRFGLVTIHGQDYQIVDIGMRMLTPRELYRAQGFPEDYVIGDRPEQGLSLSKTAQVRMCGNSVCPPLAAAIVRANYDPAHAFPPPEPIELPDTGLFWRAEMDFTEQPPRGAP